MSARDAAPGSETVDIIIHAGGPAGFPQRTGKGEMIRDLARAVGDAGQRSGKGGKSGGGLGGQKAGGIKGGGKRKTHFGRKRGPGGR
jgi:hypothetical protein